MNEYNKITALYSRLSVGDEDRDGGESNSIVNQKAFLERYAQQQRLTNIRHYIDDDESGRFFDRSAYSRMMEDVENGKIGVCIMKDLTRWGRDYLQVGNAMEVWQSMSLLMLSIRPQRTVWAIPSSRALWKRTQTLTGYLSLTRANRNCPYPMNA